MVAFIAASVFNVDRCKRSFQLIKQTGKFY